MVQLDISYGVNFTCRRCGDCCRGRTVPLIPGEKEKLETLGLGPSSPRLAGISLFVPMPAGDGTAGAAFRLAHDRGSCVFLEEDGSCLVHNLHGHQAKPLACRKYPLEFVQEPHSTVVSASFDCRSVVEGTGAPLREQEVEIRALEAELMSVPEEGRAVPGDGIFHVPERIVLTAQIGLDWYSYQAIEQAMVELLDDETHTLAVRLLAMHGLVSAAVAQYGRGFKTVAAFVTWMERMNSGHGQRWLFQEATSGNGGSARRQNRVLAVLVSSAESRYAARLGVRHESGVLQGAAALARGSGRTHLPSLSANLDLGAASRVALDQDSPVLRSLLVHYLGEYLRRKCLLRYPNLLKGTIYFLVHFALVRWYAVALAVLRGEPSVGIGELRGAIRAVERCYLREDALPRALAESRSFALLTGLLMDLASSPEDLVHNPYRGVQDTTLST